MRLVRVFVTEDLWGLIIGADINLYIFCSIHCNSISFVASNNGAPDLLFLLSLAEMEQIIGAMFCHVLNKDNHLIVTSSFLQRCIKVQSCV
jgi:hypothetical protein